MLSRGPTSFTTVPNDLSNRTLEVSAVINHSSRLQLPQSLLSWGRREPHFLVGIVVEQGGLAVAATGPGMQAGPWAEIPPLPAGASSPSAGRSHYFLLASRFLSVGPGRDTTRHSHGVTGSPEHPRGPHSAFLHCL